MKNTTNESVILELTKTYVYMLRWQGKLKENSRAKKFAYSTIQSLNVLIDWVQKNKEWNHDVTKEAVGLVSDFYRGLARVGRSSRLIICEECNHSKAINCEDDNWRNLCPYCEFSYMFSMTVAVPSIKNYGVFPPPLTLDEEFLAASNGFPLAGISKKFPEDVKPIAKLLFG